MNSITNILQQYEEFSLCGDGRNDSPGHSARYCFYALIEHASNVVVGKRQAVLKEKGLRRPLKMTSSEDC